MQGQKQNTNTFDALFNFFSFYCELIFILFFSLLLSVRIILKLCCQTDFVFTSARNPKDTTYPESVFILLPKYLESWFRSNRVQVQR